MKKLFVLLAFVVASFSASAQAEAFIGEIRLVGFNYAPYGWALCNGQLLSISQNNALYALLGNTYGGDGRTTFALPDLRGRVAVGQGQGQNVPVFVMGQKGGALAPLATNMAVKADSTGAGPKALIPAVATPGQNNYPPYLGLNYIICLQGIWPTRE